MATGSFVAYYRVSTERQGRSGLGLDAQQAAVRSFLNGGDWRLVAEVTEVESGKLNERPKLQEALRLCRLHGAKLIIAKLDRLSRDAHFLLGLQKADVPFVAADMPEANEMIVGIMAVVAQAERKMISARTKAALAAAKARGQKLGGDRGNIAQIRAQGTLASVATRVAKADERASQVLPMVLEAQARGASLRQIAAELTTARIPTARGVQGVWSAVQVSRVLQRAGV